MTIVNYIIKWTLPVTLSITIICFAVLFSLSFKSLYYFDINYLSIAKNSNKSEEIIKENYDILIKYLTDKKVKKLELTSFATSKEGAIHFSDVKKIFLFIKYTMYILGSYSLIGIIFSITKKQYKFLKYTSIVVFAIPLGILFVATISFDKAFIMFHKIAFTNDYWIFDPKQDPVILILPQRFFLHSFLLIIGTVLIIAVVLMMIYKIKYKMEGKLWQR